jgi:hypothetical protein
MDAEADQPYIYLSWRDNASDESAYHIERRDGIAANWVTIAAVGTNITDYIDVGECDIMYYYRVRVYCEGDGRYSDYSNVAFATWDCILPVSVQQLECHAGNLAKAN